MKGDGHGQIPGVAGRQSSPLGPTFERRQRRLHPGGCAVQVDLVGAVDADPGRREQAVDRRCTREHLAEITVAADKRGAGACDDDLQSLRQRSLQRGRHVILRAQLEADVGQQSRHVAPVAPDLLLQAVHGYGDAHAGMRDLPGSPDRDGTHGRQRSQPGKHDKGQARARGEETSIRIGRTHSHRSV